MLIFLVFKELNIRLYFSLMKKILFLFLSSLSVLLGQNNKFEKSTLIIPPKQVIWIGYPLYDRFNVKLWNRSKFDLRISARDRKTDSLYKVFGLAKGGSTILEVNKHVSGFPAQCHKKEKRKEIKLRRLVKNVSK